MGERRAETATREIDALFRLGVVGEMSDGQLLERFREQSDAGGQIAFEAIVRRHGPVVLGVCRRVLGHYQAAEDAFQATFLVLALKARTVRKQESLGPWLHGVAVRIARRALGASRRHQHEPLSAEHLVAATAAGDPDLADLGMILDEELERLPEKYRLPVVLCYLEGRTQEEVARTLGWTKGTVSGRLARAKDLLRHRLVRRGLAPSAGLVAAALVAPTASAAVPATLLSQTVRAATAAMLGGIEAGLGAGPVASLVRRALRFMLLGKIARAAAVSLTLAITAAAIAAPVLLISDPARPGGRVHARAKEMVPSVARPDPSTLAARLDRFGDPLPERARTRLGTIQRRHSKPVVGIDFTGDGQAVSVQSDGRAYFWDTASGRLARAVTLTGDVPNEEHIIRGFAISPNGMRLAAAGYVIDAARRRDAHVVWIWDVDPQRPGQTLALRRRFEVETLDLHCLAFAPDGSAIATGGNAGDVQVWDVATGELRSAFTLGPFSVFSLAFAPGGNIIATGDQGHGIKLRDLEEDRETFLANPRCTTAAPRFSADGRLMAVIELGGQVAIWDRTTGGPIFAVPGSAVAFAADSRSMAVAGSRDGMLAVVDTVTGLERWKVHTGWGSFPAGPVFSADGRTILIEQGGVLRFFDTDSGSERFDSSQSHQADVTALRYAPDGRVIFTTGDDGTVREWDAASARQLRVIPQGGRVSLLEVSPDGSRFATFSQSPEASVSVWDVTTGERRRRWSWPGGGFPADALAFRTDGEALLVYGRDRGQRVLEIATGLERPADNRMLNLTGESLPLEGMIEAAFTAGNRFLAVATSDAAHVADLATGIKRCSSPYRGMAFDPAGNIWAVALPGPPEVMEFVDGRKRSFEWSAHAISLVDLESGNNRRIVIPNDLVAALALSPDGKTLAVAGGRRQPLIRLYETDEGHELESFTIPAAVSRRRGLAFSPDGRSLAAGLSDTTIAVWDVRDPH